MANPTSQSAILVAGALALCAPAFAQLPVDDQRVRDLENQVRQLQREVDTQSRRIETLEQAVRITSPLPAAVQGLHTDNSPSWLVGASWDRVKPGMSALDVIAILGRPTSSRHDAVGKLTVLFYAMELGPDTVLSGTVRVGVGGVVEVNHPVMKSIGR